MNRMHGHTSAALILISIGLFFAALPLNSLELRWGIDADGSSGLLEFILAALPLAIGSFALARIFASHNGWRRRRRLLQSPSTARKCPPVDLTFLSTTPLS
jgi:hypothetical protein